MVIQTCSKNREENKPCSAKLKPRMMLPLKFFITSALLLLPSIHLESLTVRDSYDPGTCARSNRGELVLVKDREDKDAIVMCTEDKGIYSWKTTEGSKPLGEYFNPGYDCLEILSQNTKAKDGYYWVDFHRSVPHKVWCDMNTDGGGYILIGNMNNTVTWNVPSSNSTVEPFGTPHFSSAFGDISILDFRIQVATDVQYKHIVAHWSYRFRKKRPMKELLMVNDGGCPYNLPGIGDILYVKNLITEKISKQFSCSVFGRYGYPSHRIGWAMMNYCLEKQCFYGFAYHHFYPIQVDWYGGFSFLAGNNSGTASDGSTAFFGCDNGKCCACYGPAGGDGVYCGEQCKVKNGGKISRNAHARFWVRLNPPRKVWERCMEYKTEEENGDAAWYKLVGDRNIPVKGRCGRDEANLNPGIVAVPDDAAYDRVPKISGLLAYQKDIEKLHLRKNDTWKVVAEEEMVKNLTRQVFMMNNAIIGRLEVLEQMMHFPSKILFGQPSLIAQLKQWLPQLHTGLVVCYRSSEDGWGSMRFHSGCDNKGPTVTLIRVHSYIFGGYTDVSWGGTIGYKRSTKSFIFSFRNADRIGPFSADVYRHSEKAIFSSPAYGPIFGGGSDFSVVNNADQSTASYTNLGYTYRPPPGYRYQASNTRALLAGSFHYTPSEVEVFYFE
ncbi:uncharacterized protein LOC114527785 [Dendronephthya gigantea]|uniref:uncharacterized protein LOC114527785 n=1 Tax=Dendronephthya gigantea TaxID=151771 RepID=UPI00106C3AB1|nr:uncharacterized protein LOC114527785 [Dendronephthya gigantea]